MALPDYVTLATGTSRETGIANASVAHTYNYLSSTVIDNATNLDALADFEIVWQYQSSAPAANKSLRLYIVYSFDGTNYEDAASDTTEPVRLTLIKAWSPPADTAMHRIVVGNFPLLPLKFKLLVRNHDTNAQATVSVNCRTRKASQIVD